MTIKGIKRATAFVCSIMTIIAVTVAVYYFQNFLTVQQEWENKNNELSKTQAEIEDIKKSLARFEEEKKEFEKYLFSEQDVPAFLEGISEFAAQSTMNVLDMKTKKFEAVRVAQTAGLEPTDDQRKSAAETPGYTKNELKRVATLAAMPIAFKLEGTYPAFVTFLNSLENFAQLITISDVEIKSGKEYPILTCGFTLKIYSLKTLDELDYK